MKQHAKNDFARRHGISKAFRQNSERYGSGVFDLVSEHQKYRFSAQTLDQAASERRIKRNPFGIDPLKVPV